MDDPQVDVSGAVLQKRDRLSYAILSQVSGEYRGEFRDGALVTTLGIRAPFFKRDLNNYCFTTSDTGFVACFGKDDPRTALYATANPNHSTDSRRRGPQPRVPEYETVLAK